MPGSLSWAGRAEQAATGQCDRLASCVLWRKRSFGSQSAGGCRLVERLLTVMGTRRLQHKPVLAYLEDAVRAHRAGLPIPNLI